MFAAFSVKQTDWNSSSWKLFSLSLSLLLKQGNMVNNCNELSRKWKKNHELFDFYSFFYFFFFLRSLVSLLYSPCIWAGLEQNICSLTQENVRKYLVYPCSILVWDSFTRILYGKMHSKTGKDSAGKSNSQFRRSIVFRFLNGCSGDEIIKFMEMVFENFKHFVTGKCN